MSNFALVMPFDFPFMTTLCMLIGLKTTVRKHEIYQNKKIFIIWEAYSSIP